MATLDSIIKQMILSAFRSAKMTSASPGHINRFVGIEADGGMEMVGSEGEINQAIREAVQEITEKSEGTDSKENIFDAVQKKGTKEKQAAAVIGKGASILQNPNDIAMEFARFLPHAALVLIAVSIAPLVFEQMTRPGGPLDLRFKRMIDEEINAFLSRQTQKDTEFGTRQVIIQSKGGFTAINGDNNYNTIRGIREGGIDKERLDRIGMKDHTRGVFETG